MSPSAEESINRCRTRKRGTRTGPSVSCHWGLPLPTCKDHLISIKDRHDIAPQSLNSATAIHFLQLGVWSGRRKLQTSRRRFKEVKAVLYKIRNARLRNRWEKDPKICDQVFILEYIKSSWFFLIVNVEKKKRTWKWTVNYWLRRMAEVGETHHEIKPMWSCQNKSIQSICLFLIRTMGFLAK